MISGTRSARRVKFGHALLLSYAVTPFGLNFDLHPRGPHKTPKTGSIKRECVGDLSECNKEYNGSK